MVAAVVAALFLQIPKKYPQARIQLLLEQGARLAEAEARGGLTEVTQAQVA